MEGTGHILLTVKKNVKVPKDSEPSELTFEECEELIIKAPVRTRRRFAKKSK